MVFCFSLVAVSSYNFWFWRSFHTHICKVASETAHDFKNPFTSFPLWMGVLYAVLTLLMLLYFVLFMFLKRLEERYIWRLGDTSSYLLRGAGVYVRVAPLAMKVGHYTILILTCLQIISLIRVENCQHVVWKDLSEKEHVSELREFAAYSIIIYLLVWLFHHLFLPLIWRRMMVPMFFDYEPVDQDRSLLWSWMFIRSGPN